LVLPGSASLKFFPGPLSHANMSRLRRVFLRPFDDRAGASSSASLLDDE
jgi:hypothetical protein